LAAVPEKYQGFIQSSIRKVFIDVPSISRLTKEVSSLKGQVKTLSKEKKDLIARSERQCAAYDQAEGEWKLKMEELLFDYSELRKEHESLKFKYAFHMYVLVFPSSLLTASHTPTVVMARVPHPPLVVAAATTL